jgi:hypothetical protein
MKIRIFSNRFILVLFMLLCNSGLFSRDCNEWYYATISQFEFDYQTKTNSSIGGMMGSACIGEHIEFYFEVYATNNPNTEKSVVMGVGSNILTHNLHDNLIDYLNGKKSFPFDSPKGDKLIKKWRVMLQSSFKNSDTPSQTILSMEIYSRIKEDSGQYGTQFNIQQLVISSEELRKSKELSATSDNILLDTIIKDNPHPKIFLYQSQDKICYATIEVHSELKNTQLNDVTDETNKIPYCFDIMYKNSLNYVKTFKKICADEIIEIDPEITIKTKQNEEHRFKIKCKITPIKFISDTIKLEIEIDGKHISKTGSGGSTKIYKKEINIAESDVIEIQLPPDWPNFRTGDSIDPKTLTPIKEEKISSGIKEHSLFIRPVRVD